eukprot:Clim_evm10s200 gene=Clim_evmTU10s200
MDRLLPAELTAGRRPHLLDYEDEVRVQSSVGVYDGDSKSDLDQGDVYLTNCSIYWVNKNSEFAVRLPLSRVTEIGYSMPFLKSSAKVKLSLTPLSKEQRRESMMESKTGAHHIKLSFREGGSTAFHEEILKAMRKKHWLQAEQHKPGLAPVPSADGGASPRLSAMEAAFKAPSITPTEPGAAASQAPRSFTTSRAGIGGIRRNVDMASINQARAVDTAFSDLDSLMEQAKDMVALADRFAKRLQEPDSSITDKETSEFKEWMQNLGIDKPVTREAYGNDRSFYQNLSRQLAEFLVSGPLERNGGSMTLIDVYCLYNRARGMAMISPEDLLAACREFETLHLPVQLKQYASGVMIVTDTNLMEEKALQEISDLVVQKTCMTAGDLASINRASVTIATQQLLNAEQQGLLCRDDTFEGLYFYPNLFLGF